MMIDEFTVELRHLLGEGRVAVRQERGPRAGQVTLTVTVDDTWDYVAEGHKDRVCQHVLQEIRSELRSGALAANVQVVD